MYLQVISFKKITKKKSSRKKNLLSIGNVTDSQNGKLLPCPKSFVTFPPGARALRASIIMPTRQAGKVTRQKKFLLAERMRRAIRNSPAQNGRIASSCGYVGSPSLLL